MNMDQEPKSIVHFVQRKVTATAILLLTFLGLTGITATIFWLAITNTLDQYLNQQTEVLGNSLATQAAFNTTQSILTNDLLSLNVLLTRLVADDNILSAHVYNKKDELLAEASSLPSNGNEITSDDNKKVFSSIVKFRQENVGHVLITLDRTPSQNTLAALNNLLLSLSVFLGAIGLVITYLIGRFLFTPINNAKDALLAFHKGYQDAKLTPAFYQEAHRLKNSVEVIQNTDWEEKFAKPETLPEPESSDTPSKPQIEFNFDQFFEEDKQRNCLLFIELENMNTWQKEYTPVQIANLFTPVYRAMFQASKAYLGHVHQYDDHSAVILFSAHECDDLLYTNAICTARLFKGLIDNLMQSEIYFETPEIEYKIGIDQSIADAKNKMNTQAFHDNVNKLRTLMRPLESKSLVLTEDIFTLPEMQNKVFTSLPDIFTDNNGEEILSYCVRDLSKSLTKKVETQIQKITEN
ncbi:hypothetical protein CBF23_001080 [Marinomonas agarivorans]|nr:hypothetical protein CBF23_001080 [Marinomonas agarivorans]